MAFRISWPGTSTKILQSFGTDPTYWKDYYYIGTDGKSYPFEGNDGIAIEAEDRSEVKACASGLVKVTNNIGDVRPYGNTITLEHLDGETIYQTVYCHLFNIQVTVGQQVQQGDVIGLAGSTGSAIGSQLKVIVKKIGATAAGQTSYRTTDGRDINYYNDSVDPADYLIPPPDTRPIQTDYNATFKYTVNVRSGPSESFKPRLYTGPKGDALQVLAISSDKQWFRILHNTKEGWAPVDYVTYNGDITTLPVETGSELKVIAPHQGSTDTNRTQSGFKATFKYTVNVRSGPSENFKPRLYTAPKGDALQVLAISSDKQWFRILHNANEGWAPADYITHNGDITTLPIETGSELNAIFKNAVNVRSGPSKHFNPPIYTARKGDALQVLAISSDKKWYRILHNTKEGWAHVDYVIYNGDVSTLPVETGPELKIITPLQVPNHPVRGMHDGAPQWGKGAADWMVANRIRGWAVDMVYCRGEDNLEKTYPHGFEGRHNVDYTAAQNAGVRVILRWNFSFAKSEGGGGTFGDPTNDERLIHFIGRGIKNTKGVWGHIIGNEPNRAGENSDYENRHNIGTPIRPERIAKIIKGVRKIVGSGHRLSPPALDGTNTESFQKYGQEIDIPNVFYSKLIDLLLPTDVDWIALHGYSRGAGDAPSNTKKFDNFPLEWQFFGFRMWEPFADILRKKGLDWERKPIVITETNHLKRNCRGGWNDAQHNGWDDDAHDWIQSVYDYIRKWNQQPTEQFVHGLVLYRLSQDEWELEDKSNLIQALRASGEQPL